MTTLVSPATVPRIVPAPSAAALREFFLLDPDWTFLNHGSFGACPRPVFETYQRLQVELERQPLEFLEREYPDRLDTARQSVAAYVGADVDGLVFVPNTTTGVNAVASSVDLRPGDEVLITDHEYGGCVISWRAICARRGARLVVADLPDPLVDADGIVAALDAAATPATKVVYFSHLTSVTAAILPAARICRWARERGITSVVDGAHVPGQIPLDIGEVGADAYVGNCHKWLCAPKGAALLWVAEWLRDRVWPPVLSWGCDQEAPFATRFGWGGTHDPAAVLSVPAAIVFQDRMRWDAVRARGRALADRFVAVMADLFPARSPRRGPEGYGQMVSVPVPWPSDRAAELQGLLRERRIEVAVRGWNGRTLVRPSFQGYNDAADSDRLTRALGELL